MAVNVIVFIQCASCRVKTNNENKCLESSFYQSHCTVTFDIARIKKLNNNFNKRANYKGK